VGEAVIRLTWWRIFLWKAMRRFASSSLLAANYPDLPMMHPSDWVILERGHWGTLAFTNIGDGRRLVTIFKGFDQGSAGILLTEAHVKALLESYEQKAAP
jgi:hypothetical protein